MKLSLKKEMEDLLARVLDADQWKEIDNRGRRHIKETVEYRLRMGGLRGKGKALAREIFDICVRRRV